MNHILEGLGFVLEKHRPEYDSDCKLVNECRQKQHSLQLPYATPKRFISELVAQHIEGTECKIEETHPYPPLGEVDELL